MKLVELVKHLKSVEEAERFVSRELANVELYGVGIYMKDNLDIDSDVKLFDEELLSGYIKIESNGIQYENLLPFNMAQEMVEAYMNLEGQMTDLEIAKALLSYSINDA